MTAEREVGRDKSSSVFHEVSTLHVFGAIDLREAALNVAGHTDDVSGFVIVCDATGMQLTSEAFGEGALPTHVMVAGHKMKTVLAMRRSTSVQRRRMKDQEQTREDFDDLLGSLLGGGVAIFADPEKKQFIGGIAFSGGTQEQDEQICRTAIENVGFYHDLPEEPSTQK